MRTSMSSGATSTRLAAASGCTWATTGPHAGGALSTRPGSAIRARAGRCSNAVIQEIVVERGAERRLVHFWYRTSRSAHVVGELPHAWDRFLGRLTLGRADGAFVRLSTPLDGEGPESGRARLRSFGRALDEQLAVHWPTESLAGAATARDG